jgi:hypothetical protein
MVSPTSVINLSTASRVLTLPSGKTLGKWNNPWRGHFRITQIPPQCSFEPVRRAKHQVRVTLCRLQSRPGRFLLAHQRRIWHGPSTPYACFYRLWPMELIRGALFRLAHSTVSHMSLEGCNATSCAVNVGANPLERRVEVLNKVYDIMVKERKADVLSSLSLGNIVCADCAKTTETAYQRWCTMIWEKLPHMFGVGKSWEEL